MRTHHRRAQPRRPARNRRIADGRNQKSSRLHFGRNGQGPPFVSNWNRDDGTLSADLDATCAKLADEERHGLAEGIHALWLGLEHR